MNGMNKKNSVNKVSEKEIEMKKQKAWKPALCVDKAPSGVFFSGDSSGQILTARADQI
ncbi:hypothetical protein AAK899_06505 [Erysipelotrichaceae bacterium 51-3]|uniref:hypothetical protein n=1 Tax=Allobaculum sp. JKK-2023 TaxID=3108943 RepID=UPI002B05AB5E|nr:hypothetical protein [Allobaculum sp. JKK-2023]